MDSAELVNVDDDPSAITADPRLGALTSVVLPRWNAGNGDFGAGATTICQAFSRLATSYCVPASGSPALNAANPANAPNHDLLRRARSATPAVGACERP